MGTSISAATHKEYKTYFINDAIELWKFIGLLRTYAGEGKRTPYNNKMFIGHAVTNKNTIKNLVNKALTDDTSEVNIPASIIFWVYRSCIGMGEVCPVELSHVCKFPSDMGEKFFITTKEEWLAHRAETVMEKNKIKLSDHAKLNYLSRVLGIDVDNLLEDFPHTTLEKGKGKKLEDGRYQFEIGEFIYVIADSTCITILNKGMVIR